MIRKSGLFSVVESAYSAKLARGATSGFSPALVWQTPGPKDMTSSMRPSGSSWWLANVMSGAVTVCPSSFRPMLSPVGSVKLAAPAGAAQRSAAAISAVVSEGTRASGRGITRR